MIAPTDLTAAQHEAVEHFEGPLLVLAGPGSGKTRVITRRIARLVERGVAAKQILAITFTNKAANEMAERVQALLPGSRVWVSTFHKFCARVLRQHSEACGLQPNFSILDTSDQRAIMRQVLSNLDIDAAHFTPDRLGHAISSAKNRLQTSAMFADSTRQGGGGYFDSILAKVYPAYQKALLDSNAVDFDDLLLHVCLLLDENPEIRSELDDLHRFILVDEYQDTNLAQYRIVSALSADYPNLCATGDPDQSIYGWRGAEIGNILRFERDFPSARVVRLEHNFRSTPEILRAADELIVHNEQRKAKTLIAQNDSGRKVELLCFTDEKHEADGMARYIRRMAHEAGRRWDDFAVFYRVNALSRQVELALTRHKIPFQVAAGVAFYERAEIKDLLAYLRLTHNPADRTAFLRAVNRPQRGVGATSVKKLESWAATNHLSLLNAARQAGDIPELKGSKKAIVALPHFARMIDELGRDDTGSIESLLTRLLERSGYTAGLRAAADEDHQQRLANVEEFVTAAREYDQAHRDGDGSLQDFLEQSSLVGDVDALSENTGKVTLMTLHAAKGLEFPVVFVLGVEHNLIPHERSIRSGDPHELEEERRLLFVGITRAREELYLTKTDVREFRGRRMFTIPSPFQFELGSVVMRPAADLVATGHAEDDSFDVAEADDAETSFDPAKFADGGESASDADDDGFGPDAGDEPQREVGVEHRPPPVGRTSNTSNSPARLMTGADLLNGTLRDDQSVSAFQVGMKVRHPQYGMGTVIVADGAGRLGRVTVEFSSGEQRSYVLAKCPLQPVG